MDAAFSAHCLAACLCVVWASLFFRWRLTRGVSFAASAGLACKPSGRWRQTARLMLLSHFSPASALLLVVNVCSLLCADV